MQIRSEEAEQKKILTLKEKEEKRIKNEIIEK